MGARKTPAEVLQLRIFENQKSIQLTLLFPVVGLLAGLVDLTPMMLRFSAPVGWALAWTAVFAGCTIDGLALAVRLFRVLPNPLEMPAKEVT